MWRERERERSTARMISRLGKKMGGCVAEEKLLVVPLGRKWKFGIRVGIQWRADDLIFYFETCPNYQKMP